jgi:hypothetical protein
MQSSSDLHINAYSLENTSDLGVVKQWYKAGKPGPSKGLHASKPPNRGAIIVVTYTVFQRLYTMSKRLKQATTGKGAQQTQAACGSGVVDGAAVAASTQAPPAPLQSGADGAALAGGAISGDQHTACRGDVAPGASQGRPDAGGDDASLLKEFSWMANKAGLVIADEAHQIRNPETKVRENERPHSFTGSMLRLHACGEPAALPRHTSLDDRMPPSAVGFGSRVAILDAFRERFCTPTKLSACCVCVVWFTRMHTVPAALVAPFCVQVYQAVAQVATKRRVALTGYPLMNKLDEYWNMIEWTCPGFFPNKTLFNATYKVLPQLLRSTCTLPWAVPRDPPALQR